MGNTPSAEEFPQGASHKTAYRTPHRLSKLRTNKNDLEPPWSPTDPSGINSPGYSSFYLAGSLPPPVAEVPQSPAIDDQFTRYGSFRSTSERNFGPQDEIRNPATRDQLRRANSMVNVEGTQALSRSYSMRASAQERCASIHSDMALYEAREFAEWNHGQLQELQIAAAESRYDVLQDAEIVRRESFTNPQPVSPLMRTNSDMSLYVPMRRRSLAQTPGVATRPSRDELSMPTKQNLRKSQPLAPTQILGPEVVKLERCLSMPPPPIRSESPVRVSTPCDGNYRQLGGIKFGSLRITNGSPVPSVDREIDRPKSNTPTALREVIDTNIVEKESTSWPLANSESQVRPAPRRPFSAGPWTAHQVYREGEELTTKPRVSVFHTQLRADNARTVPAALDDNINPIEYEASEILDIRIDPSAKPIPTQDHLEAERPNNTVSRSDSGFGSTSSTESSRKTLSKADSGYSSNFSLRSLRHSMSRIRGSDRSPIENSTTQRPSDRKAQQQPSPALPSSAVRELSDGGSSGAVKAPVSTSASSKSLRGLRRLSMKPSQARQAENTDIRKHSRKRSISAPQPPPQRSERLASGPSSKKGNSSRSKFYRFLAGSDEGNLPQNFAKHEINDTVPCVPLEVEARLQAHSGGFPTAPQRLALRVEPSKESLMTIMSEESADVPEPYIRETSLAPDLKDLGRQKRLSLQTIIPSLNTHARKSIRHRPLDPTAEAAPGNCESDADNNRVDVSKQLSLPAFVSAADVRRSRSASRSRQRLSKANTSAPKSQADAGNSPSIRPQASAPNLRHSAQPSPTASAAELASRRLSSKTPPPVSMRSGRLKNINIPPPLPSQRNPIEMLPPQWLAVSATSSHESSQFQPLGDSYFSQALPSSQESTFRRQSSSGAEARRLSDTQGAAPYRVLHSYDSPAYRNVPIWN